MELNSTNKPQICSCGKRCYTKADANAWLNNLRNGHRTASHIGKGANIPQRAYHCDLCGMWHTTHFKRAAVGFKPNKPKMRVYQRDAENDYGRIKSSLRGGLNLADLDL